MMTCREVMELLLELVADELSAEQNQQIHDHFQACPPCLIILETYRITIELTRALPCKPLPPPCEQRLRAAVAAQCKQQMSGNT